jgi:hypothetical protein
MALMLWLNGQHDDDDEPGVQPDFMNHQQSMLHATVPVRHKVLHTVMRNMLRKHCAWLYNSSFTAA